MRNVRTRGRRTGTRSGDVEGLGEVKDQEEDAIPAVRGDHDPAFESCPDKPEDRDAVYGSTVEKQERGLGEEGNDHATKIVELRRRRLSCGSVPRSFRLPTADFRRGPCDPPETPVTL